MSTVSQHSVQRRSLVMLLSCIAWVFAFARGARAQENETPIQTPLSTLEIDEADGLHMLVVGTDGRPCESFDGGVSFSALESPSLEQTTFGLSRGGELWAQDSAGGLWIWSSPRRGDASGDEAAESGWSALGVLPPELGAVREVHVFDGGLVWETGSALAHRVSPSDEWWVFHEREELDGTRVEEDGVFRTVVWNGICGGYNYRAQGIVGDPASQLGGDGIEHLSYEEFVWSSWAELPDGLGVGFRRNGETYGELTRHGVPREFQGAASPRYHACPNPGILGEDFDCRATVFPVGDDVVIATTEGAALVSSEGATTQIRDAITGHPELVVLAAGGSPLHVILISNEDGSLWRWREDSGLVGFELGGCEQRR